MEKLVLQEIWSDFPATKLKKPYNSIITIALVLTGVVLLGLTSVDIACIAITFIILSNGMLKSDISDCIYFIPINVREYIKAKYRITVIIELLLYGAIEALRCIQYIIIHEKLSDAFVVEHVFVAVGLISYVLIKNTWLLYVNFGLKEVQTYKIAQGLSIVWFFFIAVIAEIAEEKIMNTVPLVIELIVTGGFIVYGIYICVYVKKNLIIKTFR